MIDLKKYILPRKKYLIKNNYHVINPNRNQFHTIINYIEDNKIEIIIRKLNQNNGWDFDLKIKIFDLKNNNQYIISVGSSQENLKIIELNTSFNVEKKIHKKIKYIPKKIIQTNKKICDNHFHFNSVMTLLEHNPDYEYLFFDDNDSREFIKNNFFSHLNNENKINKNEVPDILQAYDLIMPGAIKADLFRYCYMYIYGGIYIDSKISTFISFDDIIDEEDKYIIIRDDAPKSFYNGILIFEKENERILKMIKQIINHVMEKKYLSDIHEPTGNKLFYTFFNEDFKTKLNKSGNNVNIDKRRIFNCDYPNYSRISHNFRDDYFKKKYYFKKTDYINQYSFSFYNTLNKDEYKIFSLKEDLFFIKRIDSDMGWGDKIYLRIYDPFNKKYIEKVIEKSKENEVVFTL